MRWLAAAVLTVALAVTLTTPAAFAKGKPTTSGKGKTRLVLFESSTTVTATACGNPYDMQPDPTLYATVCFTGCTSGDGESQLWGVVLDPAGQPDAFDVAAVELNFGCTDWYYWT